MSFVFHSARNESLRFYEDGQMNKLYWGGEVYDLYSCFAVIISHVHSCPVLSYPICSESKLKQS